MSSNASARTEISHRDSGDCASSRAERGTDPREGRLADSSTGSHNETQPAPGGEPKSPLRECAWKQGGEAFVPDPSSCLKAVTNALKRCQKFALDRDQPSHGRLL